MRRLHVQFYLAILATLAVFLVAIAVFWTFTGNWRGEESGIRAASQLAQGLLPPAAAPAIEQQRSIDDLREQFKMSFALYDSTDRLLATAGGIPPLGRRRLQHAGWTLARGGHVWILPLADGRRLVVRPLHSHPSAGAHVLIVPVSIVLAFALGAYPIARRLTRRLARLQAGVEQLGQGDLTTRIPMEGRDEVAALARSFNHSAERIEELVGSHKLLLANCSHELRTPLARIRLGLERIARDSDPALRDELTRSIAELDTLIGEMLLASRLDALQSLEHSEDVDLLALAAEEAAHLDRAVEGRSAIVRGDPALLRRMVRNLLDNARRHGGGATRIHVGEPAVGTAELVVEDHGYGIPEAEREKIFEPFYRSARASTATRGFGLGLALVRQIARAHGGEVQYTPLTPAGSRFVVTLRSSPQGDRKSGCVK
jgi:signal transduction histidine kinase